MRPSLRMLVGKRYSDKQKMKVAQVVRDIVDNTKPTDKHLLNYKVLSVGLDGLADEATPDDVASMYGITDLDELTEIDYVLANIVLTLEKITGEEIYKGYQEALTLDPNEPEFDYLVNKVDQVLKNNKEEM